MKHRSEPRGAGARPEDAGHHRRPDATGSEASKDRLSLARASNVRDYLRNLGVDPNRMIVNVRSEREPIASNDTAGGRAQNRRVEILLSEPTARG